MSRQSGQGPLDSKGGRVASAHGCEGNSSRYTVRRFRFAVAKCAMLAGRSMMTCRCRSIAIGVGSEGSKSD